MHLHFDRRLRLYKSLSLDELLADKDIKTDQLMPKQQPDLVVELNNPADSDPAPFPAYLPLHIFDDDEYDCRTPDEWINMGRQNGNRYPVPGKALLPTNDEDRMSKCFFFDEALKLLLFNNPNINIFFGLFSEPIARLISSLREDCIIW